METVTLQNSASATQSHFERDCLWIVRQVQRNVDLFPGVVAFVLLTIQQPFAMIADCVADVAKFGVKSRFMWGWKPAGFVYAVEHKAELHDAAVRCFNGEIDLAALILEYMAIPGLGIAKASFLAQLTVGQGACLDVLNLRRLGLNEAAFKTPKSLKIETVKAKIEAYQAVCDATGGSRYWWNSWCDGLAARKTISAGRLKANGLEITRATKGFATGCEVSALHRLAVEGGIE